MSTEDTMLQNSELTIERIRVKELKYQLEVLRDFAIWMSGCADFGSLPYFREHRHLLYPAPRHEDIQILEVPIRWDAKK